MMLLQEWQELQLLEPQLEHEEEPAVGCITPEPLSIIDMQRDMIRLAGFRQDGQVAGSVLWLSRRIISNLFLHSSQ